MFEWIWIFLRLRFVKLSTIFFAFIWSCNKIPELKGKQILYYDELGEPSHATALDYLINEYDPLYFTMHLIYY